jgi:hypothetical protein
LDVAVCSTWHFPGISEWLPLEGRCAHFSRDIGITSSLSSLPSIVIVSLVRKVSWSASRPYFWSELSRTGVCSTVRRIARMCDVRSKNRIWLPKSKETRSESKIDYSLIVR